MRSNPLRMAVMLGLFAASPLALAHTGHGADTLREGLTHPLGLDHLLAALAVGLWSAAAWRGQARLAGPGVFLAALLGGSFAAVFAGGLALPQIESALGASVVVLALMLAAAQQQQRCLGACVMLVALAGALHGWTHGMELSSAGGFAAYAGGFLVSTALLHAAGLALGAGMLRKHRTLWQLVSAVLGLAGVALMATA